MGLRIAFGLLDTSEDVHDPAVSVKARSLTVSWMRWGYQGDIIEDRMVDRILLRAAEEGYDYCLVQSHGHIITEQSGPVGRRPLDFLERLRLWLEAEDIFVAGQIVWRARGGYGLTSRCLLVNLKDYKRFGYPAFGDGLSADPEQCDTFFGSVPGDAGGIPACELQGGRLVAAGFAHNATVRGFPPELAAFLVDFGSDLTRQSGVLDAIARQAEQVRSGVFVLNFEGYEDIEVPPPGFRPPVSALYSVAAGLKPNRILATHGFAADTRVVYFDYSEQALNFRRLMVQRWDGRDLPRFLGENMRCAPADGAHYFLWPGASASDPDWAEMDRLWRLELDRWGGGCLRHRVYELPQWDRERSHQE